MIRHIVYRNQLLLLSRDDASDVFLKFVVMFWFYEALPAFDGEHDMEIDLCVGICLPLLAELENLYLVWFYRDFAPTALLVTSSIPKMVGQCVFVRDIGFRMDSSFGPCAGNCGNSNARRSLKPTSRRLE